MMHHTLRRRAGRADGGRPGGPRGPSVYALPMTRLRSLLTALTLVALLPLAAAQDLVLLVMADTHSAYDRYPRLLALIEDTVAGYPDSAVAIVFDGDLFELGNAAARNSAGSGDWAFLERGSTPSCDLTRAGGQSARPRWPN